MVQIQVLQKPRVVDLDDLQGLQDAPSCATLQIREQVERRSFSLMKSLMVVGTALLVVMMVSRAVWMQNMWARVEDGQDQLVEFVGYGHEVGKTLETITRFLIPSYIWIKEGIFSHLPTPFPLPSQINKSYKQAWYEPWLALISFELATFEETLQHK